MSQNQPDRYIGDRFQEIGPKQKQLSGQRRIAGARLD